MSIFKAYDIRGIFPEEINAGIAGQIAQAYAFWKRPKSAVVGMDCRASSREILQAVAQGLSVQGADVSIIGLCTTPLLNYCVASQGFDAGIMVSASHNPANYNGLKIVEYPVLQLSSETGMNELEQVFRTKSFLRNSVRPGTIGEQSFLEDYLDHLLGFCKDWQNIKSVCDYGNGVGAITAKPLLERAGLNAVHLLEEPDASFPVHEPNPHHVENFSLLKKKVLEEKADIGFFFDGDADRAAVVDNKGEIVFADFLVGLLAMQELKKHQGERVYFDLRFSKAVSEAIEDSGGIPVMMRVGNPFYKKSLVEKGGLIGGEFSGHIMFRQNNCIDDGLFAAIKLLNLLAETGKPLSELVEPLKKYFQTEEINLRVENADAVIEKVKQKYSDGKSLELDGLHISYPTWWFSLRQSHTEPFVRLRIEAGSQELLERKRAELVALLQAQA